MIIGMRIATVCLVLCLGLSATPAAAQFNTNSFSNPDYGIELQPPYPQPGETVTATLTDYRGSSYGSNVSWVFNGTVIPESENQRSVRVTAGPANSTETIEVVLTRAGGGREVLRAEMRPVYLDIIIEPQTRTPDHYLGRALPSIGSVVNATALISGRGFRNPDLIYTWRLGQQTIEGGPVRGRNQVSFPMPMGSGEVLTVQVTELDGSIIARRSVLLPSVTPEIHFYEVSSLFGMSKQTITGAVPLIGNSVVVRAEPYFLDSRVFNDPDVATWKLGGVTTNSGGGNPYEVTLQRVGASGVTNLEFHVRDLDQVLQGAEASTRINF